MTNQWERLAGALTDRYRLDREVGSGGMATVYAAQDLKHDREVALKVLRPELGVAVGADRFQREIAIAARLQHPHIVPLLDSGVADGLLYYVMPYVRGESLRERLVREGTVTIPATARIMLDVADALRYAHEQGIVHRDIKPENIMLSGRHAVVMDFGVARAVARQPGASGQATTIGVALGTPAYMAPEQAAADPNIDHRADLYALGVVGYEMLIGRPPFHADTPQQVLAAQVTEPPPPIQGLRPDLPVAFADVVMRCLAKRAADRWEDAATLGRALEPFAVTSSDALTPVSSRARAAVSVPRRAGAAGLAVVALALAAVAAGVIRRPSPLVVAGTEHLTVDPGLELDPAISPDGNLVAYTTGTVGRMRVFVRQLDGGNPIPVAPDLHLSQRWPRWSPDGRRIAFQAGGGIWLAPALGGQAERLVDGDPTRPAGSVAWSPDGGEIAYTQDGTIYARDVQGSDPRALAADFEAHSLTWSPDGGVLAYVSGNLDFIFGEGQLGNVARSVLRVLPARGGTPVDLTATDAMAMSPAWLPNGRELLLVSTAGGGRDVYRLRLSRNRREPAGELERLTTGLQVHSVAVSRDGLHVALATFTPSANVWRAAILPRGTNSSQLADQVTTGVQTVEDLDVSPDGRVLLFDANRGESQDLYRLDLATGTVTQISRDPSDEFGPVLSPDGTEVAFYAMIDGVRRVVVMDADGGNRRILTDEKYHANQPQWSPDGKRLVFARWDSTLTRFPMLLARQADGTWGPPEPVGTEPGWSPTWSPDGRRIAVTDADGALRVIDLDTNANRLILAGEALGGGTLVRPVWLDADHVLIRQQLPDGQGGIWSVSVQPGAPNPQPVLWMDEGRPSLRDDYVIGDQSIFFVVSELEGDLWLLTLRRP